MAKDPPNDTFARSMRRAFLALGSNMGEREANLKKAIAALGSHPQIGVLKESSFHDTAPVGNLRQGRFLNGVLEIKTTLGPEELLDAALEIESELGRVRTRRWGPRTIDIDILAMENLVYESPRLSIPHPLMHERSFVLEPLCEIAPDFIHPVLGTSIDQMLALCAQR